MVYYTIRNDLSSKCTCHVPSYWQEAIPPLNICDFEYFQEVNASHKCTGWEKHGDSICKLWKTFTPPEIIQNGRHSGGWMSLVSTLARNMTSAFWWRFICKWWRKWQPVELFLAEVVVCEVSVLWQYHTSQLLLSSFWQPKSLFCGIVNGFK